MRVLILFGLMMVVGWVGFGLVVVAVTIGCVGNLLGNINYFILLCKNIILMSRTRK